MHFQNNLALAFDLAVMTLFFCFTNVLFWYFDFGKNPIDNRRIANKHAELESSSPAAESGQQLP